MRQRHPTRLTAAVAIALLVGCASPRDAGESSPLSIPEGKIPVSTRSPEALALYLGARQHQENLRLTEARRGYQAAVDLDDNFALAHFGLVATAPTSQELYDSLKRASQAAYHRASEAEQWLIHGFQFGVNSNPAAQLEYYQMLAEAYPEDERAQRALGDFYFGEQRYAEALEQYRRASEIAPDFAPVYNDLGYCYRELGRYDEAEEALKRYVKLIPDEPNPYDSYAELLMNTGRFLESIGTYREALEREPGFFSSHLGIANNRILLEETEEARRVLQEAAQVAADASEERLVYLFTAASYLHEGKNDAALAEVRKIYEMAAASGDRFDMASELLLLGDVERDSGDVAAARATYAQALAIANEADVSEYVRLRFQRTILYRETRLAIVEADLDATLQRLEEYREKVDVRKVGFEVARIHELEGRRALAANDFARATEELALADQENTWVLYLQALAWRGRGDTEIARGFAERAAHWNGLDTSLQFAFVHSLTLDLLAEL